MSDEYQDQSDEQSQGSDGASQSDADTAVAVAPVEARPKRQMLPPFKVLLHNDDVNDMAFVVAKVVELTHLTIDEAIERMLEAHKTGVAMLLVTHRERAELYCEQFATYSLVATSEPA